MVRTGLGYAPASASRQVLEGNLSSHGGILRRSKVRRYLSGHRAQSTTLATLSRETAFRRTWAVRSWNTAAASCTCSLKHCYSPMRPYDRPMDMATQHGCTPEDHSYHLPPPPLPRNYNKLPRPNTSRHYRECMSPLEKYTETGGMGIGAYSKQRE